MLLTVLKECFKQRSGLALNAIITTVNTRSFIFTTIIPAAAESNNRRNGDQQHLIKFASVNTSATCRWHEAGTHCV